MQVGQVTGFADRRESIGDARVALRDVASWLFQASGAELTEFVGDLDDLMRVAAAARVAATAEAAGRGEIVASTSPGTTAWVREHAPTTAEGGAADVAACALAANTRGDRQRVGAAVIDAEFSARTGATILREMEKLRAEVIPGAMESVTEALLIMGRRHGPDGVKMVRPELLSRFGSREFQRDQDKRRTRVELSRGVENDGITEYDLALDNESRAILEAAIGPLSKPVPGPDGERDTRTFAQRRGQALIEALRRGLSSAVLPGASTKSTVVVVVDEERLRDGRGAGRVLGGVDAGMLLGSETVRKLACDGHVMPLVRDAFGRILDAGRSERYITREMLKALWVRDQQCTFGGCTAPAFWCDGHHLIHWADGGPTSLDNSALLCGGHHTVVHRDRLAGRLIEGQVVWDYTAGSYDRHLNEWREQHPPPDLQADSVVAQQDQRRWFGPPPPGDDQAWQQFRDWVDGGALWVDEDGNIAA